MLSRAVEAVQPSDKAYLVLFLIAAAFVSLIFLLRRMAERRWIIGDEDSEDARSGPFLNPGTGSMMLDRDGLDIEGNIYGVSKTSSISDDDF